MSLYKTLYLLPSTSHDMTKMLIETLSIKTNKQNNCTLKNRFNLTYNGDASAVSIHTLENAIRCN